MIEAFLEERSWLLADGALGSNLRARGLDAETAPELWNETHPRAVRRLHQDFVDAGADIILTNSFGANAARLRRHDAEDRVHAINVLAARHARAVSDTIERHILVAGCVGPTGEQIGADFSDADAITIFGEQIEGLKDGGIELIWIETMGSLAEIRAAATAAAAAELPYVVSAYFGPALTPTALAAASPDFPGTLEALGVNCGAGPADVLVSVLALTEALPEAVIVAKASCGLPHIAGERATYPATPALMAEYACLAVDAGARIIGGCCGTTATHLAAMRAALLAHTRGPRPGAADIAARLAPFAAPGAALELGDR
ncbi:MAG: betaine--homocysteine S-methyltransferase [Rhodospirillales bacterium]|nr:betaine--homocysteine S-methyltransferase [Rhodospirillales bacterium]MDE2574434.1 betaine--homocysteine S-methyltransferase [Rhodospirillales bacterium]